MPANRIWFLSGILLLVIPLVYLTVAGVNADSLISVVPKLIFEPWLLAVASGAMILSGTQSLATARKVSNRMLLAGGLCFFVIPLVYLSAYFGREDNLFEALLNFLFVPWMMVIALALVFISSATRLVVIWRSGIGQAKRDILLFLIGTLPAAYALYYMFKDKNL